MNSPLCTLALAITILLPALSAVAQVQDQLKHSLPGVNAQGQFGYSVAVDGGYTVVGAPLDNTNGTSSGAVKVFDTATGALLHALTNPTPSVNDNFGSAVAISGTRVVVAAIGDNSGGSTGAVYIYHLGGGTPTLAALTLNRPPMTTGGQFGNSVSISGTRVVISAVGDYVGGVSVGSAYVFDIGGSSPTVTLNNPSPNAGDYFGNSVGISGTRVVVGAKFDDTVGSSTGSAYVYDVGGGNTVPIATLNDPNPPGSDYFGSSVGISGTRVVVGAIQESVGGANSGAAYIYDLSGGSPTTPSLTLHNPKQTTGIWFGYAVSISGTRFAVGTFYGAYVYDLASPTPAIPLATLKSFNPTGDGFGSSVSISGTSLAVGDRFFNQVGANAAGSAYIYGPSPYSLWKVSELNDQFATDLGDTDGDGLGNLGEYGLLHSPIIPEATAATAAPALYAEGTRMRMLVPRDPARNDITLEVQATGNLPGAWTTIATSTLGTPFTGPGYVGGDSATPGVKSVEVRDTVNLPDAPQRYLRVRVRH